MYNASLQSSSVTIHHNNFDYNIYWKNTCTTATVTSGTEEKTYMVSAILHKRTLALMCTTGVCTKVGP